MQRDRNSFATVSSWKQSFCTLSNWNIKKNDQINQFTLLLKHVSLLLSLKTDSYKNNLKIKKTVKPESLRSVSPLCRCDVTKVALMPWAGSLGFLSPLKMPFKLLTQISLCVHYMYWIRQQSKFNALFLKSILMEVTEISLLFSYNPHFASKTNSCCEARNCRHRCHSVRQTCLLIR